ncbi:conjugal transfer protein TraD [Chryseobacterium shandongense]|uniref:Conjugal transfer protein TraD n=1 Tax=Chryseobacterium shandongense TaxID=1493872 RepID=A0AAD0YF02_9FLAO|nr:conjugal transfer protein TraD [Chryseobacterium shandongense]AZA85456.1 conjugal transfer protein TraD [Chryseobacterium shandongense]AZA97563.1 conjugal transfer protein TraD [Chryseobacterium shandongense]
METAILICQLIIIGLLLHDKIVAKKKPNKVTIDNQQNHSLSTIIGKTKPVKRKSVPMTSIESQSDEVPINPTTLDIEFDENENIDQQILKEEPEKGFSNQPDFEEEEEEWKKYRTPGENNGLAYGVNFEELSSVEYFLKNEDHSELSQKKIVQETVHKIYGTELFRLLENSIDGASQKIAELLDKSLNTEIQHGSSNLQKGDFNDFNIGKFV